MDHDAMTHIPDLFWLTKSWILTHPEVNIFLAMTQPWRTIPGGHKFRLAIDKCITQHSKIILEIYKLYTYAISEKNAGYSRYILQTCIKCCVFSYIA